MEAATARGTGPPRAGGAKKRDWDNYKLKRLEKPQETGRNYKKELLRWCFAVFSKFSRGTL